MENTTHSPTKDEVKTLLRHGGSREAIATSLKNYFLANFKKPEPVIVPPDPNDKIIEIAQSIFGVDNRGPAIA